MPRVLLASPLPDDGKTTIAAGLAGALRQAAPHPSVRLVRAPGANDAEDATVFCHVPGVRAAAPGGPTSADALPDDTDLTLIEVPDPPQAAALRQPDSRLLLITRYGQADDTTLQRAAAALQPHGLIVNACPQDARAAAQARAQALALPLLATLPQDRLLSAPLLAEVAAAIDGDFTGPPPLRQEASAWLQVGPISAHGGIDYFSRYPDKTVVTRHDKVDVALAALDARPLCLILTGGPPNLPYIAQRAEQEDFALIVTPLDTVQAVDAIGRLYGHGPFAGERKIQRAIDLLAAQPALLGALTSTPA